MRTRSLIDYGFETSRASRWIGACSEYTVGRVARGSSAWQVQPPRSNGGVTCTPAYHSVTGADLLAELQSSLGAAYTFDRELGGGGMARVFLAHERGLGRPVVIKLLNPELAEGINADRFEREIKLAASLQQANIVPLLSAGRAARYAYYTMPFVEGLSLRDRLTRDSVVPIGEGISLLKDVARALAYAHERHPSGD